MTLELKGGDFLAPDNKQGLSSLAHEMFLTSGDIPSRTLLSLREKYNLVVTNLHGEGSDS